MRHVTRIAARNLCIPNSLMRTLIDKLSDTELKVSLIGKKDL